MFVGITGILIALRIHWVIAFTIGFPAGLVLMAVLSDLAERFWPRPPRLDFHAVHMESTGLKELADLLELIASANSWPNELDRRLGVLSKSLDDWLYDAALEAAEQYRDALTGRPPAKKSKDRVRPGLEEQQEELRAIARDLRLAAGDWLP